MESISVQIKTPLFLDPKDYSGDEWCTILNIFGMAKAELIVIKDCKFEAFL